MPALSQMDQIVLHISTCDGTTLAAYAQSGRRYPFPVADLVRQATSDRLQLAGGHLRSADTQLLHGQYRSSISRHYYAMYHSARAITYASIVGDDHQQHAKLPRHLPSALPNRIQMEIDLSDARLLRNSADYDPYPATDAEWETDARGLSVTAAIFVQACENFALQQGFV